jgi:hypothetical protein
MMGYASQLFLVRIFFDNRGTQFYRQASKGSEKQALPEFSYCRHPVSQLSSFYDLFRSLSVASKITHAKMTL